MNNVALVSVIQRRSHCPPDAQRFGNHQRPIGDQTFQRPARDKAHHDVKLALEFAEIINRQDVRVLQPGNRFGLALEQAHSLLVRRSTDGTLAYYLAWQTTPVAFADLIAVAGRRWAIEEAFQIAKDQFGLDHTQVRSWHGWHRHATLTMIAYALTALAIRDDQPEPATTAHELAHPISPIAVTIKN